MKLSNPSNQSGTNRGVALVIVLAMLVLLSALLVAFMSTATTERASSYANAGVSTARQIADSTVSLVISQIRDATSQPDEAVTWASQPGAIRTFSGGISGAKENLKDGAYYQTYRAGSKDFTYKLYSSEVMKMETAKYETDEANGLPSEVEVIEEWDRLKPKKNWVDLNEPNLSPRSDLTPAGTFVEPHYPIIDPRAAYDLSEQPTTSGNGIVHGFDAKIVEDQNLQLPTKAKVPYLPMPVKWLYVLRDGTIGPASRATVANPMVGRTAFWTDDETCKLNINTASEGTFWDSPCMSLEQESGMLGAGPRENLVISLTSLSLAASQPIKGEFQRYPGHPATTCLSPALGWLWGLTATTPVWPFRTDYRAFKEAIYAMSPFIETGIPTSQGASKNTDAWLNPTTTTVDTPYFHAKSGMIKRIIPTKHLYSTVDEMLFKPERFRANSGVPELNPKLTPEALEKLRFFLTANSRAPELNAFSRPRVTLWPVHADFENRTTFDDIFLFTSTISKGADYRRESDDVRYNLFRYDAKDDMNDYSSTELFGQNIRMFEYLQDLTGRNYPGYGGTLVNTWGGGAEGGIERDTILNLIFDYTRTVNLVDTGTAARTGNVFAPYTPKFFIIPVGLTEDYTRRYRSFDWCGQVTPLKINPGSGYQGLGRFPTISEVALVFCGTNSARGAPAMRAVLAMEMTTPMPGYPAIRETYFTKVRALRDVQFRFSNSPQFVFMGFKSDKLINIPNVSSHEVTDGRGFMPTLSATTAMHWFPEHLGPTDGTKYPTNPKLDPNRHKAEPPPCLAKTFTNLKGNERYKRGETVKYYPYVSNSFEVPLSTAQNPAKFDFKGGKFEIEIWSGEAPSDSGGDPRARLVQTITVDFPPNAEVKGLATPTLADSPDMQARFDGSLGGNRDFIRSAPNGDVVRSMELIASVDPTRPNTHGDVRLAMARTVVPPEFFRERDGPAAYISATRLVHGLTVSHGDSVTGNTGLTGTPGRLAGPNGSYRVSKPAILPKATNGVQRDDGGPGDFDRGLSKHMSGAFGNKVDEGNLQFSYGDGSPSGRIPYYRGRQIEETGQTYHAPNRQLPSAVMLGSLPTGVVRKLPWQTLLFRPDRETGRSHPGAGGDNRPPEHLVLDLFHVPIVEPYAISEPFSTAGKVNLNHIIAPFGYASTGGQGKKPYLRRDTALRGVLKSTFVTAVPLTIRDGGHTEVPHEIPTSTLNTRFPIDLDRTLEAVETRLKAKNQLFRSASEICTVDLYPAGQGATVPPVTNWSAFWASNGWTGDNIRERPYAHIYPRVTTKSNVYTVHMRCQAIRKSPKSDPTEFNPEKDQVVGDYRGSATVERFIDPNDAALIKYKERSEKVDPYYRYRVVNTKHFAPR